jgi:hypothetical protein
MERMKIITLSGLFLFCLLIIARFLLSGEPVCPYKNSPRWKQGIRNYKPCTSCHQEKSGETGAAKERSEELVLPPPPVPLHSAPPCAVLGEELPIDVTFDNPDIVKEIRLYYQTLVTRSYVPVVMDKITPRRFRGLVPKEKTRCLSINYYFEVTDVYGRTTTAYREETNPWSLPLEKRADSQYAHYLMAGGLTLSPIVVALAVLKLKSYRERRKLLSEVFWVKLLLPYLALSGFELNERLSELSRRPLEHPVEGTRVYPRDYIYRQITRIREMDLYHLLRRKEMYMGRGDGLDFQIKKRRR